MWLQDEGGANQTSAYCQDLLMRGGEELSFEELRAERYRQLKQKENEERLRRLKEEAEQLRQELQQKKQLLQLITHQDAGMPPAATSFHIYDESAAARPAGNDAASPNQLPDDVFLQPDERGLCVQVRLPGRPGAVPPSELSQTADPVQPGLPNTEPECAPIRTTDGQQGRTSEDVQVPPDPPGPLAVSQKAASKPREKLSPIHEASVEAGSQSSAGGLSAGNCSPLDQDPPSQNLDQDPPSQNLDQDPPSQNLDQLDPESDHTAGTDAVDPCDPDVRRRLLDLGDITSSPDLHTEPCPLPDVEERSFLDLGGDMVYIQSRVLDGGRWSIFKGSTEDDYVFLKVDSCSAPWDFYQFNRLKGGCSRPEGLPLVSCFLFADGCITVYTTPKDHMFTELPASVFTKLSVGCKVVGLLQLVLQLHSCGLLHAALQPDILACCHIGFQDSDWIFPVDWSSSVHLGVQRDVLAVQNLPSAQAYVSLGLLEPTAPPQLVDLVGVAETAHLLLTDSRMVPVKDSSGWTAESFSSSEPCDLYSGMWRRFFRSLLNAGGRSSSSILSELKEQLSSLHL